MKPRFAKGEGPPPPFVYIIGGTCDHGTLVVEGLNEVFPYASNVDFIRQLRALTDRGVSFSVGGHIPGAADELAHLQVTGAYPFPFFQISWSCPSIWSIHEMIPGAKPPWELVDVSELIRNE